MGKVIWVVILIIVVVLLWFLFRSDDATAPSDTETGDNTEQEANVSGSLDESTTDEESSEEDSEGGAMEVDASMETSVEVQ